MKNLNLNQQNNALINFLEYSEEKEKITWVEILNLLLAIATYIFVMATIIFATVAAIVSTIIISADCWKRFSNKSFSSENGKLEAWVEKSKRELVENQFKTLIEIANPKLTRNEINRVNYEDLEKQIKKIIAERNFFHQKIEEERIIHQDAMKVMDNWYRRIDNEKKN